MDISDPKTNMYITVFLAGLLANITLDVIRWWQTKGQYDQNNIVIKFDARVIVTSVISLLPIAILTGLGFSSLVNTVNASNPASYMGAFVTAYITVLAANWGLNKQLTFNPVQKNELKMINIKETAKLHEFNEKIKEESNKSA
ncbi:MAG: hypothetical protein ACTHME_03340 [Candidatus Nitrosocosmicus sp.]